MKVSTTMASVAAVAGLIFAVGCGGGGGGGASSATKVAGIWNGTYTSALGAATMDVEYVQNGTVLDGTARFTRAGTVYTGGLTGTVSGNTITASVTVTNILNFGVVTCTLRASGNTITGSFVRANNDVVAETGTVSLAKSNIASSPNLAGTYALTATSALGVQTPLAVTIIQRAQDGDSFMLQETANRIEFNGSGVIIGNTLTASLQANLTGNPPTVYVTNITGTVSGNSISGTTIEPGYNTGNNGVQQNGTFTLASSP